MTRQEAIRILKAKLACMEREVRGTNEDCNEQNCFNCDLGYKQGTMGEQMEALQTAIDALGKDRNVLSKTFTVIDIKTGKEADTYEIALHEEWAKHLMYCDMEGFAVEEDGTLILLDECGRHEYCPVGRFEVRWDEE